jgi:hypothetical protein
LSFDFSIRPSNVTGVYLLTFVQQLHTPLTRLRLLMWDRFSGHKKAAGLLQQIYDRRIQVAYLSAYAPALHVVDHAWGHTKYGEMTNFIPTDLDELADEVAASLIAKHYGSALFKAFSNMLGSTSARALVSSKISNSFQPNVSLFFGEHDRDIAELTQ